MQLHDFPTPRGIVSATIRRLQADPPPRTILDPGAGRGTWGRYAIPAWPDARILGIEIQPLPNPPDFPYHLWLPNQDFLTTTPVPTVDLIVGNPPFNQAEAFVRHGLQFLAPGGRLVFLLRLALLAGQNRRKTDFHAGLAEVLVLPKRPVFVKERSDPRTEYAIFIWAQGYTGRPQLGWLDWEKE